MLRSRNLGFDLFTILWCSVNNLMSDESTKHFSLHRPQDGSTVLHVASSRGHEACVQLLLESAAAANGLLDDQDKWGNTALHLAVRKRHAQVGSQKESK